MKKETYYIWHPEAPSPHPSINNEIYLLRNNIFYRKYLSKERPWQTLKWKVLHNFNNCKYPGSKDKDKDKVLNYYKEITKKEAFIKLL